jgi:hypothetical protein
MINEIPWRRSSFSGGGDASGANYVEAAILPDGRIAFRDSKNPSAAMSITHTEARTWLAKIKST